MRLVQLTFFTAALLLVSKTTPSYKPLELYQHNVMIDKPQKDVSLLDEALANVDKYPRMETHTEDLQCYSYLECYRLGLDFIATNEMFLLMQNFGFSAEELMVSVIYTTNMYYEFNKRIRAVAANPNLDHTDTGMNGYRVFYHRLLDALGKIEETQMSSSKSAI